MRPIIVICRENASFFRYGGLKPWFHLGYFVKEEEKYSAARGSDLRDPGHIFVRWRGFPGYSLHNFHHDRLSDETGIPMEMISSTDTDGERKKIGSFSCPEINF